MSCHSLKSLFVQCSITSSAVSLHHHSCGKFRNIKEIGLKMPKMEVFKFRRIFVKKSIEISEILETPTWVMQVQRLEVEWHLQSGDKCQKETFGGSKKRVSTNNSSNRSRQEGRKEEEGGMGIKKCLKFCKNTGGNEEMKKRRNEEMKKARNEETRKPRKKKQRREEMKKQRKEDRRPRRNEETRKRKVETQKKKGNTFPHVRRSCPHHL